MMTKIPTVNVLVTGLGPYPAGGGHIDNNISHAITRMLPSHLVPNTAVNPSPLNITITTLRHWINTEYGYIRQFCQELYGGVLKTAETNTTNSSPSNGTGLLNDIDINKIDVVIHLGEARGWQFMSIERMAFKQGFTSSWWGLPPQLSYYQFPDNKGQTIDDIGPCPWDSVPMGLQSAFNIDAVAEGANTILNNRSRFAGKVFKSSSSVDTELTLGGTSTDDLAFAQFLCPQAIQSKVSGKVSSRPTSLNIQDTLLDHPIDIRPHREGGFYCCGFTNYESLANCYVNQRTANVLFCHIPGLEDEKSMIWQKDGVLAVIVSAANEIHQRRL